MTPADVAVRRRLMLSMHAELLGYVAEVMNCDVELCADELATTFGGNVEPYRRAILEEVQRRFTTERMHWKNWTVESLTAYQILSGRRSAL